MYLRHVVLCSDGSGRGTCTCTCETKPVPQSSDAESASGIVHPVKPVQESYVPQSASLLRTATRPRQSAAQQKTAKQQQQQQPPPQPQNQRSGIINVPPMKDYGLNNAYEPIGSEQSNFAEPEAEPQQPQQEQENAQQQYV